MKLINSNNELEVGEYYWASDKQNSQIASKRKWYLGNIGMFLLNKDEVPFRKYWGSHQMPVWCYEANNQLLSQYHVIGPVPYPKEDPDLFERIIMLANKETTLDKKLESWFTQMDKDRKEHFSKVTYPRYECPSANCDAKQSEEDYQKDLKVYHSHLCGICENSFIKDWVRVE